MKPSEREISEFLTDAGFGKLAEVEIFLDKYPKSVDVKDERNNTALILAAEEGHDALVTLLLDRGASVDVLNKNCVGALYFAIQNNHVSTAKILLEKGSDLERDASTGFIGVAQNGHVEMLNLLLEKGLPVDKEVGRNTMLMLAVKWKKLEAVTVLLDKGADIALTDKDGETALDIAHKEGSEDIISAIETHAEKLRVRREKEHAQWQKMTDFSLGIGKNITARKPLRLKP
jgi:ankyrin repeat protein